MFRISSRNAPHNLYADTELVREKIDDRGFYFLQPGPEPLYTFGLNQNNWQPGANKITVKYSEFTTVIWKLDNDRYSRFIIDNYSDNKEAVAHNFISQDGNYMIFSNSNDCNFTRPIIQRPCNNITKCPYCRSRFCIRI